MRLSPKDFDVFQRAALALHECRDVETLLRALPAILLTAIPGDYAGLHEVHFTPGRDGAKIVRTIDPSGQITPEMERLSQEMLLEHPFPKYFARTGDWSALRLSDLQSPSQFLRTDIYQRFYRVLGVDRLLGMPSRFGPRAVGGMAVCRRRKDFSERDTLLLDLLRPHIELAHRNAAAWTALRRAEARVAEPRRREALAALTSREREIARWLAAGKTNREIGLIIQANVRTVEKHVEKILSKLAVENRATAAVLLAHPAQA